VRRTQIAGNVSGLGATKHDEFAMACGEMSLHPLYRMDWLHLEEMVGATKEIYSELKNICVWNKSNAGMGSLYRSKHEFIFVFKRSRISII
jgi:hypothetical protein